MKRAFNIFSFLIVITTMNFSFAQGFAGKGSHTLLLGLGMNYHGTYFADRGSSFHGIEGLRYSSYGALNFQYEIGIHKYVGLGVFAALEGTPNLGRSYHSYFYNNSDKAYAGFAVPVGFLANFHFLQLIADKTGKNFADKLDVYAGLSVGAGPSFAIVKAGHKDHLEPNSGPLVYFGGNVGIRFYPSSNVGIFAELGYGKTVAQGGVCFKL